MASSSSTVLLLLLTVAARDVAADSRVPWDDLESQLDAPESLSNAVADEWRQQCLRPFFDAQQQQQQQQQQPGANSLLQNIESTVSNYDLLDKSSGLCMDHVSCIYKDCLWPYPDFDAVNPYTLDPVAFDDNDIFKDRMNLPAKVLHPTSTADLVRAISFVAEHKVGVSVKVAGHSYFGASTVNNTMLVKMTSYNKYAISGQGLKECADFGIVDAPVTSSATSANVNAYEMACNLAVARGKKAVLRVGGGEMFDEAYRAVSFDWNSKPANANKYHLVGGGAGTVSAAGGWLASGGLSGTTGMRMHGIGVDQVLHIEMALPSGTHVRFGPTEWEPAEGFVYPKTTKVTGFCNANPLASTEDGWDWQPCTEDINFDDLWFAVRGGGGGSYGIVTAVYYQLHNKPGNLQVTDFVVDFMTEDVTSRAQYNTFVAMYVEFVLRFLYVPSSLGVSDKDSDYCGSAMSASFNPFTLNVFLCYDGAGDVFVQAWKTYISDETRQAAMRDNAFPQEWITAYSDVAFVRTTVPSFAHATANFDPASRVPFGRLADSPPGSVVPVLLSYPNLVDAKNLHIPTQTIVDKLDDLVAIVTEDALSATGAARFYALGGKVAFAHDQTTSLSPNRRSAGFLKSVISDELQERYLDLFYGSDDNAPVISDEFPGSSCHNHALIYEMGPLKADWTKPCSMSMPQSEREEKCISQNEAAWGTVNLVRLEAIKTEIDPDGLFVCAGGIGYDKDLRKTPEATEAPTPSDGVSRMESAVTSTVVTVSVLFTATAVMA